MSDLLWDIKYALWQIGALIVWGVGVLAHNNVAGIVGLSLLVIDLLAWHFLRPKGKHRKTRGPDIEELDLTDEEPDDSEHFPPL